MRKESRISHLIKFINQIFQNRKYQDLDISLISYSIVTLNLITNFIEFVPNSRTLIEIIKKSQAKEENKKVELQYFKKNLKPKYELKNYLLNISTDECFFAIHNNYIKSHAAWSALGLLIGLGDRHLMNILIRENTGELIHIDFDMIFKKAKYLPVAEKIDFRMTNSFVMALGILSYYGMFKVYFEQTIAIFKQEFEKIKRMMDVFVKDPLSDKSNIITLYQSMNFDEIFKKNAKELTELTECNANVNVLKDMFIGWDPLN